MVSVKKTPSKVSTAKKNITIKGAIVKALHFEDESGDVTSQVLDAIPPEFENIDVKISLEIPDDEESDDEE
jgi:hypothetical protein